MKKVVYVVVENNGDWISAISAFTDLLEAERFRDSLLKDYALSQMPDADFVWIDTVDLVE